MNKRRLLGISFILLAIVIGNSYLLLKNNNIILKSYAVNVTQFATKDKNEEKFHTEAVVVSDKEHYIAVEMNAISEVQVVKGQDVLAMDPLATYRSENTEQARSQLQAKIDAYNAELSQLQNILMTLESEGNFSNSSTSTDGSTIGQENWRVELSIELGIQQNTPTAEGKAIIQRTIAETEREIDILTNQLEQIDAINAVTTPVDGVVANILLEGEFITFVIQQASKKLVTYVDEEAWYNIQLDQYASFVLFQSDVEKEQLVEGTVSQKQQIPVSSAIGYDLLLNHNKPPSSDIVYEVSITPAEPLSAVPIGHKTTATIITNEAPNSYETYRDWLVHYEIDNIGSTHVYTIAYDGKTRLVPVEVLFEHQTTVHSTPPVQAEPVTPTQSVEGDEQPVEVKVPPPPRIQNVHLASETKQRTQYPLEPQPDTAVVFEASTDDTILIANGREKNIYAPTFRTLPLQTFDRAQVGPLSWKDVFIYMLPY